MSVKRQPKSQVDGGPKSQVVGLRSVAAPKPALGAGAHFARLAKSLGAGRYEATLMTGERMDVGVAPEVDVELAEQCLAEGEIVLLGARGDDAVIYGALRTKAARPDEVLIEAPKRLVLRAGKARLTLTSEGKIKLLGSEVTIDAPREVRIASARVEIP